MGLSNRRSFYSTDNLNTITQINTSGTGFTGGCQSVAYVSFLNAYIICDMGGYKVQLNTVLFHQHCNQI